MHPGPRVLLVDDEDAVRSAVAGLLYGYASNIVQCSSVNSAVSFLAEHDSDIVICDMCMPEVHGLELIKEIRKQKRDVAFVVMTGKPDLPDVITALRLQAAGFLQKPFTRAELLDAMDTAYRALRNQRRIAKRLTLMSSEVEEKSLRLREALAKLEVTERSSLEALVAALDAMRTAVLLSQSVTPPRVILITSSLESEGKSLTAINLAVAFAQTGKKTLLVDTDLRRGTLRRRFGLTGSEGLSNILAGQSNTPLRHSIDGVPNLHVLTAGSKSPNPSELLSSEPMRALLKRFIAEYDFVVLDSAPVLPVTDSVTLNTMSDITLLLARVGVTEKAQKARSYQMLRNGGKHSSGSS